MNAWAFLNFLGHAPGMPPKSTPTLVFRGEEELEEEEEQFLNLALRWGLKC